MKVIRCSIENFGKLNDYERNFSEGSTVFLERNAWGKSTLAAFIKVMFFGFAGESKKLLADREREKYRPWNKGTYGGKLSLKPAESGTFCSVPSARKKRTTAPSSTMRLPI